MTHAISSAASRGRELLRGLGALLALLVLVIVVPALLLVLAPPFLPAMPSSRESLWQALRSADDGGLLVAVVVLVAWVGWAVLTVCVALEVASVLRAAPTPRVPALGSAQRLASRLVASVALLLSSPSTPSLAVSLPVVAPAAVPIGQPAAAPDVQLAALSVVTDTAGTTSTGSDHRRAGAATRRAYPTVVVQRHDTLWGLAERHLGSGLRYTEIVRLNRGVTQPDGRALHDPSWIYPGWVLRLPRDATGADAAHARPTHAARVAGTAGRIVVDRGTASTGPTTRPDPDGSDTAVDRGADLRAAPSAVTGSSAPVPVPRPPVTDLGVGASPTYDAQGIALADESVPPLVALGLGALTIAGVIAEINRQRKRFQRRRLPGELPATVCASVAAAEQVLRAVDSVSVPRRVRAGLALLADVYADTGAPLPRVELVRASAEELELVLAVDTPPVAPFRRRGERVWVWDGLADEPMPRSDRVDPCPGLVVVGSDGPYQILVNLEAAGTLSVLSEDGAQEDARAVGAAIALDLRQRAGSGALTTAWVESGGEDTGAGRAARDAQVAELLAAGGVADVHEARQAGVAEDAWAPEVLVGPGAPSTGTPWSGAAAVVVGDQASSGWALTGAGDSWRLTPAEIPVRPQRLTREDEALVVGLVAPEPLRPRAVSRADDLLGLLLAGGSRALLADRLRERLLTEEGPTRAGAPGAPHVLLLGPVRVSGVDDLLIPGRVQRATELAAYLATHGGVRRQQLDEALWPGRRVERGTRNPLVSRTRQWLGRTSDGEPYLPLVADGGEYRLSPDVGCDWYDLRRTAAQALDDAEDPLLLQSVLGSVRGRPFSGVDDKGYGWADVIAQRMVAILVDLFHLLACGQLERGDLAGAAQSAARGLAIEPVSELLHRDAIVAAHLAGNPEGTARAVARLELSAEVLDLGDDLEPDTIELLRRIRAM